jgi:ABC-type multidrug transport system ATPase subunit
MIGVCPQEDTLFNGMTPFQHIEMIVTLSNVAIPSGDVKSYATTLLEKVQLEEALNIPVSSFSGGMKRRLCLALSYIGRRPILFLDEPTTGLVDMFQSLPFRILLRDGMLGNLSKR